MKCANRLMPIIVVSVISALNTGCSDLDIPGSENSASIAQTEVVQQFVIDMSNGDFIAAQSKFAESLITSWSAEELERMWEGLESKHGRFVKVTESGSRKQASSILESFPDAKSYAPNSPVQFYLVCHFGDNESAESLVLELSEQSQIVFLLAGDEEHRPTRLRTDQSQLVWPGVR